MVWVTPPMITITRLMYHIDLALIRFGSWNVGTMTVRSSETVKVLERRRIDVCCVHAREKMERWKLPNGEREKSRLYKFL